MYPCASNLSREKVDSIKEYVIKALKRQLFYEEFWALNQVSFEIRKGDSVGLVGMNGSGKSTMLKVIAGVLRPTKGSVETAGTIAPMIELGAGFDHDLTARENIFLNGALIGYPKEMLEERFDDIIAFAGLERFVDVPIKNFSSACWPVWDFPLPPLWMRTFSLWMRFWLWEITSFRINARSVSGK